MMKRNPEDVCHPVPFRIHPEAGGLFPWGWAQDGWNFYWLAGETGIVAGYRWVERFHRIANTSATQLLLEITERSATVRLEDLLSDLR